jgi:hypothetical protein
MFLLWHERFWAGNSWKYAMEGTSFRVEWKGLAPLLSQKTGVRWHVQKVKASGS